MEQGVEIFLEKSVSVKIMAGKLLDGVELTIVGQRLGMVVHGNQASQNHYGPGLHQLQ
ncbi:MAG: hypothetical protein Ct9H90mP18_08400 [Gammaproteobacteria bacterium]|nr:MAG: hypothetical protein Ct9H90mP18_08400 [Gammaproteobacteria bacterium]